jgi:hypothetical protein
METSQMKCSNCEKVLPNVGYFCGGCLTQFKCKSCDNSLEKDYMGCIMCGTPKESKNDKQTSNIQSSNTFRLHETLTDRTIEATFSDNVGKDLTGILRDAYSIKLANGNGYLKQISEASNPKQDADEVIQDAQVLNNDPQSQEKKQPLGNTIPTNNQYSTLIAVAMKNLPSSETEWIVVYSFYASNFGEAIFTRQNIIEKYEQSNRKNPDRMNNLSSYIKQAVRGGFLNPLENGYSMLDSGVEKAKEIINRTNGSAPKVTKSSILKSSAENNERTKKTTSGSTKPLKRLSNIDFSPSGKESLSSLYKKFTTTSNFERNLIFVYYMQEILKMTGISVDHIYTCYDALDLMVPENLPQTVRNTKSKTGWIETTDSLNITITVKGRNKIKFWDKQD